MAGPWKKYSPFVESIYISIRLAGRSLWQRFAAASPGAGLKGMKKATMAHSCQEQGWELTQARGPGAEGEEKPF